MTEFSGKLIIDLAAIAANWSVVRDRLKPGARAGAVVKADAYGLGVDKVAPALYEAGCRAFFVANLAEARRVQACLPADVRLLVLSGCAPGEEAFFVGTNIHPVLVSYEMALRWLTSLAGRSSPSVMKVNSGMGRLGLELEELKRVCNQFDIGAAGCDMLMSHLACADEPEHPLNVEQLNRFNAMLNLFKQSVPEAKASLANSSGVFLSSDYHFDLVRPGFAVYGGNPTPSCESPVRPVVRVRLPIVQVRRLSAGQAVGYGATYTTPRDSVLLTVAGGYADGLFRSVAGKGCVYFKGTKLPMVGRVSMDSIVVDATSLFVGVADTRELPAEGDFVDLLGDEVGIDALARAAGTIGYEVLTSLGGRYRREYVASE